MVFSTTGRTKSQGICSTKVPSVKNPSKRNPNILSYSDKNVADRILSCTL